MTGRSNEYEMLSQKLGEFADTPLGAAAMDRGQGHSLQAGA